MEHGDSSAQRRESRGIAYLPSIAAFIQRVMSPSRESSAARRTSGALPLPCATATKRSQRRDTAMPIAARRRTVLHLEIVGAEAARHVGDADDSPGLARRKTRADQIEIGDAIDLVVIGNAGVAIAEAYLRPHIDFDAAAGAAPQRKARPAGQPSRGNGQAISLPALPRAAPARS